MADIMFNGPDGGFYPAFQLQFFQQVFNVYLYRCLGYAQLVGDIAGNPLVGCRQAEMADPCCLNPRHGQHLSYGAGIHRCVGDRLADLQLTILWEEVLKRDLDIEVLAPPTRLRNKFIRGIKHLPVRIAA